MRKALHIARPRSNPRTSRINAGTRPPGALRPAVFQEPTPSSPVAPLMKSYAALAAALTLFAHTGAHAQSTTAVDATALTKSATASDSRFFTDELFSALRPGVTAAQVAGMKSPFLRALAESMLKGEHAAQWRVALAEPYLPVGTVAKELKTNAYSRFENPVGLCFKAGEQVVIFVGDTKGEKLALKVHSFGREAASHTYALTPGANVLTMRGHGNAYLEYFTENAAKAPAVTVHIASGGAAQGVFDITRKHTNADWKKLLASDAGEILDIRGTRVQLAYPVATLRKVCPEKGVELIRLYDEIIGHQHAIMGLDKHGRTPKNRMFGRVIWRGYMHADGTGAAFHDNTLGSVANPDRLPAAAWGVAHEFGHVNQTRPGMKWVSTTEVTNNIFSSWTNFRLNPSDMRLEHERCDANDGLGGVAGGRFNSFLNAALVAKENWLCQYGPDKRTGYENGGDHFVKLVPMWQLQLYFGEAGFGNRDFYADIFETVRKTDESKLSNGRLQLNFMKNACDSARQDLTDFFRLTGMLKPIDRELDDYTRGQLTITEADCAELAAYARRYPKPASTVIFYMSANSVEAFKKRLPVSGTAERGVSGEGAKRTISHAAWKNAVAFETYKGAELVRVAMVGTGFKDNSATLVAFPEGATRIEAVSWNGTRSLVTGKR